MKFSRLLRKVKYDITMLLLGGFRMRCRGAHPRLGQQGCTDGAINDVYPNFNQLMLNNIFEAAVYISEKLSLASNLP